jgi:hypothetical protein
MPLPSSAHFWPSPLARLCGWLTSRLALPTSPPAVRLVARSAEVQGRHEARLLDRASGRLKVRLCFPGKVLLLEEDLDGDGVADFLLLFRRGKRLRRLGFSSIDGSPPAVLARGGHASRGARLRPGVRLGERRRQALRYQQPQRVPARGPGRRPLETDNNHWLPFTWQRVSATGGGPAAVRPGAGAERKKSARKDGGAWQGQSKIGIDE